MEKRKSAEIRGRAEPVAAIEKLRTADRKKFLRRKTSDVQSGSDSVAVANGKIDVLPREVDVMRCRADPEVDLGMSLGEPVQSMNEPLGRKIRRRAHGKRAAALALQKPLRSVPDAVERIAHDNEIGAAGFGDHQPLPFAVEKPQSEFGFECLHLMADGTLRDAELLSRAGEALVAGRGLEGLERIERRQAARHRQARS